MTWPPRNISSKRMEIEWNPQILVLAVSPLGLPGRTYMLVAHDECRVMARAC